MCEACQERLWGNYEHLVARMFDAIAQGRRAKAYEMGKRRQELEIGNGECDCAACVARGVAYKPGCPCSLCNNLAEVDASRA